MARMTAPVDEDKYINLAQRAFSDGELALSEIACRKVLVGAPDCVPALETLASIAAKVHAWPHAIAYCESAAALDPQNSHIQNKLREVREMARAPKRETKKERYLLIKSWGSGLCADLGQLLGCLLLAEISNRTPIVHWGRNCLYGDGTGSDAFRHFFEPITPLTVDDIKRRFSFFPEKWHRDNLKVEKLNRFSGDGSRLGSFQFLNRSEEVCVVDFLANILLVMPWMPPSHSMCGKPLEDLKRYLAQKYLRPRSEIEAAAARFHRDALEDMPFTAIHLRGSDKIGEEPNLHETNQKLIAAIPDHGHIFLMTDDEAILAHMKERFQNRIVHTNCQRTSNTKGVHFLPDVDRRSAGMEMMTDLCVALRADRFIGNRSSNVANMALAMKDWPDGSCRLFGSQQVNYGMLGLYTLKRNERPIGRPERRSLWKTFRSLTPLKRHAF